MSKTLRTMMAALALTSLLGLASCARNSCCMDSCGPCEVYPADCAKPCPVNCENEYFPCDPTAAPCGMGACCMAEPEETCYGCMRVYQTCDDCVVKLCQRAPEMATVGSPYPIEITITANKECADVKVHQSLPEDAVFVRSMPVVEPNGNELVWEFPHMIKGETQRICVWVKPQNEGCCLAKATVCACPQLCAYTRCAQPVVCIKKCGPECGCINGEVCYTIDVSNSGSAAAQNVVVTDYIPEGLCHRSGQRCISWDLGTLCPGQSKRMMLNLCAVKRGMVCNKATVTYCGGPECSDEACTMINEPCVEVTKTGPDWAYICKTVDYTITITNPGDLVLRNMVVDDVSASGTTIVSAPGAEVCCNRAVWCFDEICPGETKTLTVSVRSQVTGRLCNRVSVTTQSCCGPCTECAEACTEWRGIPAVHMCMVDTKDPICIGDTTMYKVCVTNRGSATDHNVKLVFKFTGELEPQTAHGPSQGTVSGNTVTFEPIDTLAPKQSVEYVVTVKGVSAGDARGEATLTSDMLKAPVVDTESTHVY